MSYCEICDIEYKKQNYATSKKHLNSKLHQNNLKIKKKTTSVEPIHELILFNILQQSDDINYSKILKFFSSFGIKSETTLKTIIKKLKDEDIVYKGNIDSDYNKILEEIIKTSDLSYPLTLDIKEAYDKFRFLGFKYAVDLMDFFEKLQKRYPDFISLGSSKIGESSDLITFKNIFIDKIKFRNNNNWQLI